MPFRGPSPAEIERLIDAALATQPGEELADVFPTDSMTFSQIEQLAARLGQRLTCRLTEQAVAQQAATLPAEVACPQCGMACRLTRHLRHLTTAAGDVAYHEPASHCPSCRRDFFSGTKEPGAR